MFKKVWLLILLVGSILAIYCYAQGNEEIVFSGVPAVKISEGGVSRVVEDLKGAKVSEAECVITKIGDILKDALCNSFPGIRLQNNSAKEI